MKKLISLACIAVLLLFLVSCARGITPWQAANGKAKCGRSLR